MPSSCLVQSPVALGQPSSSEDPTEEEIIDIALCHSPAEYKKILPTVFGSQGRLFTRWAYMKEKIDRAKQEQKYNASLDGKAIQARQAHNHSCNPTSAFESLVVVPPPRTSQKSRSKITKRYRQNNKRHPTKVQVYAQGKEDSDQPAAFVQSTKHNELPDSTNASTKLQEIDVPTDAGTYSLEVSADTDRNQNEQPPVPLDATFNSSSDSQPRDFSLPLAPAPSLHKNATVGPALAEWYRSTSASTIRNRSEPRQPTYQSCGVCQSAKCTCSPSSHPHEDEEILCGDRSCDRKWWGREYLWKYCGIELKDAWEIQRKYDGWWLCPLCLTKAKAMTAPKTISVQPSSSAAAVSHIQASARPAPEFIATNNTGRLECELSDDSEIRDRLQHLTCLLHQYTTMARNKQSTGSHWRLFDVPCVQDEALMGSKQPKDSFVQLIRKLIQVPDGVLIKELLQAESLVEMKCSTWVHSVLSDLTGDFIFDSDQPFEDATLLEKTLALAGISESDSERIVYDHRLRIARLYEQHPHDSTISVDFREHMASQQQKFVEKLNTAMLSLVGGNNETQKQHQKIAKVATELKLIIAAYKGTFEPIKPQMNEVFKGLQNVSDTVDPEGRLVLVTTMIGIQYSLPGKPWRTCLQARVELWPKRQESTDSSRSIALSQTSSIGPSSGQFVHSSLKKRRYDELPI